MAEQGGQGREEWDAAAYERTADPRFGWSRDVLDRLRFRGDETVIDAGCGPGTLTAELLERLPRGHVVAVDISRDMLRVASERLVPRYGDRVTFCRADLQSLALDRAADAILSRATFHWIPDHPRLFRTLYRALKPGGWLVAGSGGAGNIARILERVSSLMASAPFAASFAGWADPLNWAEASATERRLREAGFAHVRAGIAPDRVIMPDAEHYREFLRAVALRPHLARLGDVRLRERFLREVTQRGARDEPPFVLDLHLLSLEAQRPG